MGVTVGVNSELVKLILTQTDNPMPSADIIITNASTQDVPYGEYDITMEFLNDGYILKEVTFSVIGWMPAPDEYMTVTADGKKAFVSWNINDDLYEMYFTPVVENDAPVPSISGTFNNLYEIDSVQLRALRNTIFGDTTAQDMPENFIINVVRLPSRIDDSLKAPINGVQVGNKNYSTITANKISTDLLSWNLGNIFTPKKYSNSYDFLNTRCLLHLPYSQTIELEPTYVIGETLSITYEVSLYDGVGTINIVSSKINDVIHSEPVKIGVIVPYFNVLTNNYNSKSVELLSVYNKLNRAYMEVLRNVPANIDNPFNTTTTKIAKIGDLTGFIKVNNILLESSAIAEEKEAIINLLGSGVIIK